MLIKCMKKYFANRNSAIFSYIQMHKHYFHVRFLIRFIIFKCTNELRSIKVWGAVTAGRSFLAACRGDLQVNSHDGSTR